jgi:hypothetical protein
MSQQINLFNPLFLRQKRYFSATTMAQALGIIAAVLVVFYAVAFLQTRALETQRAETEAQGVKTRQQLADVAAKAKGRGKSAALADELQRAENTLKRQQLLLGALRGEALGDTAGFSSYLTAFARRPLEGLWLTGITVAASGTTLDLRGRAVRPELVPAYIQMLNGEPALRGRSFGELRLNVREEQPRAGAPGQVVRLVEFGLKGVRKDASSGGGS